MENILKSKIRNNFRIKDGILIINNDDEYLHNAKIDFQILLLVVEE